MVVVHYLNVVKKWWWLIVLSVLVASGSSYYAVSRAPRIYQATVAVRIGQTVTKANPTYQDFEISHQLALTYVDMVKRRAVLAGVAEALDLGYVPSKDNVSASQVPGTELIEIYVRDTSPERARDLADEIARQLILQTPAYSKENQERRAFMEEQLKSLQANIQETEAEMEEVRAKLAAANSARAIQQYQGNISALKEKQSAYQANYASFAQSTADAVNYLTIVEPATTPTRPISPNVQQTVLVAAAIGLGLAVGGAVVIELLDDTIKTPNDVSRAADVSILGAIARIPGDNGTDMLITKKDPRSPISESFRALRTNIQFSLLDTPTRTMMVTSPDPMEGKSFILANLAIVLAQAGNSVLLVDADLRRPTQHEVFGLSNERGLSRALLGSEPRIADYAQLVAIDNLPESQLDVEERRKTDDGGSYGGGELRVITSGPIPPNAADLVASERMRSLVERLKSHADFVLFDVPPVMVVTDAVMLSTRVDAVLLLNDVGHTRRARVQRAVERLRHVNANLLGVILNRVSSSGEGYHSNGYYYLREDRPGSEQAAGQTLVRRGRALLGRLRLSFLNGRKNLQRQASSGQAANQVLPGPETDAMEASRRTQQIRLEDYLPADSETGEDDENKIAQPDSVEEHLPAGTKTEEVDENEITQPILLDDSVSSDPKPDPMEASKRTQQIELGDDLLAELKIRRGNNRNKTRSMHAKDLPFPEPAAEDGEDGPAEPSAEKM
jgi:Mrp family chromosome partitioning ATPase/capsular polysaccharide biosynthesis protein